MILTAVLATRGRPELLQRTVDITVTNMSLQSTRLVVMVDEDDTETLERFAVKDHRVQVEVRPRPDSLGEKFNMGCEAAPADVYLAMVDYAPHVTPGFDALILKAASVFPDGIGVVYNHLANLSFPQINAVTHRLTELMGGMYPEWFPYWFVDHWLDDVARTIDRIAVADVWVDVSKRPGTQGMREPAFWATLYDALRYERHEVCEKIIAEMDEPEWRKTLLRQNHVMVDERAQMLNSEVRQMPAKETDTTPGYMRLREKGARRMLEILEREAPTVMQRNFDLPYAQQDPEEFAWLAERVQGARSILEVGSCMGHSIKMLARHCRPGAKIRCIDTGVGAETLAGVNTGEYLQRAMAELRADGFDAQCFLGDSHGPEAVEFARKSGPYDVVFIDGDHSYEGARSDWLDYGPLGSMVAFHDIAHRDHGVGTLWRELKATKRTHECVKSSMGTGIAHNLLARAA